MQGRCTLSVVAIAWANSLLAIDSLDYSRYAYLSQDGREFALKGPGAGVPICWFFTELRDFFDGSSFQGHMGNFLNRS
jgi:hypothetical protein